MIKVPLMPATYKTYYLPYLSQLRIVPSHQGYHSSINCIHSSILSAYHEYRMGTAILEIKQASLEIGLQRSNER